MARFGTDPPDLEPLDSAVIARVTDEEHQHIGRFAQEIWGESVSSFVRFATLRYIQLVAQQATDRTIADVMIEESRHVARLARADAEAKA